MEDRQMSRVMRDEEGRYQWVYSLPMLKNFSVLRTIIKIMVIVYIAIGVLVIGLSWNSGVSGANLKMGITVLAIVGVVVMVITVGSYFLTAVIFQGYYVAIYIMDQEKIMVKQPKNQAERAGALGTITTVAGILTNNYALAGAGIAQGDENVTKSRFEKIRSLKIIPERGEIKVHSFFNWYTVWVNAEDFHFVADYLTSRCVNARIVRK